MLPQIILISLVILALGINLAKHGEPRTDKYSFWWTLIGDIIVFALLYWGGFFNGFLK